MLIAFLTSTFFSLFSKQQGRNRAKKRKKDKSHPPDTAAHRWKAPNRGPSQGAQRSSRQWPPLAGLERVWPHQLAHNSALEADADRAFIGSTARGAQPGGALARRRRAWLGGERNAHGRGGGGGAVHSNARHARTAQRATCWSRGAAAAWPSAWDAAAAAGCTGCHRSPPLWPGAAVPERWAGRRAGRRTWSGAGGPGTGPAAATPG